MNIVAAISTGAVTAAKIAAFVGIPTREIPPRLSSLAKRRPAYVERNGYEGRFVRWKLTQAGRRAAIDVIARPPKSGTAKANARGK